MNWFGWLLLGMIMVLVRMVTRRWVWSRWLADDISDRQAKLGLFLTMFGPLFAAGLAISLASPFPRSLVLFALISVALAPAVGLGAAWMEYAMKHGVKDEMRQHGRQP